MHRRAVWCLGVWVVTHVGQHNEASGWDRGDPVADGLQGREAIDLAGHDEGRRPRCQRSLSVREPVSGHDTNPRRLRRGKALRCDRPDTLRHQTSRVPVGLRGVMSIYHLWVRRPHAFGIHIWACEVEGVQCHDWPSIRQCQRMTLLRLDIDNRCGNSYDQARSA
jgi:hypothetical protein